MSDNVVNFPNFTAYGPARADERRRLAKLFAGKSVADMRQLWDNMGEDSFSSGYDCVDIHSYMNMIGDGGYCAV